MKLIIDIPELDYECAKQRWMRGNDAHKMDYYISNGIPLDEYKAENRPKGEWDINCQGIVFCSKCKKVFNHNYDIDYMESHFNFCPNCGADTRNKNNC